MDAAALARDLIPRLRRWTPANWARPATPVPTSEPPAASGPPPAGPPRGPAPSPAAGPPRASGPPPPAAGRPAGPPSVRTAAAVGGAVGGGPALSRAEAAAAVVQRLADVGADAAGEPRRVVPREADTVLADQLAVMVDDILRTGDPAAARTAAAELTTLRTTLGYH